MKIYNNVERSGFNGDLNKVKEFMDNLWENEEEKKYENILMNEEKFILEQVKLDSGIAKNRPLRENLFLLFVSINLNIPIFIIGKPGCSKTLSVNLIDNSMNGKLSKNKFFSKYPSILKTWFQGSEKTTSEDVENLFRIAENKACSKNTQNKGEEKEQYISLIFFDEIGLCQVSNNNSLKILNFKFEYEQKKENVAFIGISNWILDASKMNRGFNLSVPEIH